MQLSLVKKEEAYINSRDIKKQPFFMRPLSQVNYGMEACSHQLQRTTPCEQLVMGLPDLNIDHEGICKGCEKGKNIKNPFSKSETKTKGMLELIHSDVCGTIPSTYLSGYE